MPRVKHAKASPWRGPGRAHPVAPIDDVESELFTLAVPTRLLPAAEAEWSRGNHPSLEAAIAAILEEALVALASME